MSGISQ